MLLIMVIALTVISVWLELRITRKIPLIRKLNEKSWFMGLAMSIALSLGLGGLFGMSGLVAGMAGLGSSMVTEPIHHANRKIRNNPQFAAQVDEYKQTYRPLWTMTKFVFAAVTLPLWGPVKFRRWIRGTSTPTPATIEVQPVQRKQLAA